MVLVNDSVKCIFYLYKSKTKFIFYLKPLTVTDQLQRGSPRRVLTNQRRRNVGGVLHAHFTLHDTAIDPKITTLIAASNQKHGGGFLRGRIDQPFVPILEVLFPGAEDVQVGDAPALT